MANWINIESRKTWIIDVPKLHPDSTKYLEFWRDAKTKCIEGLWANDFEGYRYMPGFLFFYINFCRILDVNASTKTRRSIRPLLRDVEWEIAYMMLEARGFSGWREDSEFTSCILVKEYEISKKPSILKTLKNERDERGNIVYRYCFINNDVSNELKKYKDIRENIRGLKDKPLGPPLYDNNTKNIMIFGSRGSGKSYFVGLGINLHEICFDGAKYYTDEIIQKPHEVHVNIGSWESNKSSELCEKIELCMNAFATDDELGVWGDESEDDYTPMPFYKTMAGSLTPNNSKSPWMHQYEKRINGRWLKFGTKSKIIHTNYKDNPTAAAGGRYTIMTVEECGLNPSLTMTHNSNIACCEKGSIKFGVMIYIGTSGDIEKVKESRKMFMDPDAYDIISFDDTYENSGKIGFFIPAYYANNSYKDENGNTDVEGAIEYYLERRKKAKESKDMNNYEGELMNYPMRPSEMFLTKKGNILPITELEDQYRNVLMDRNRKNYFVVGTLSFDSTTDCGIRFRPDLDSKLSPIIDYPTPKHQEQEGALIVYEPPIQEFEKGKLYTPDIYVIGHDPVDSDTEGAGLSLSAIHVLKIPGGLKKYGGNELVATYIGRPYMGREPVNELLEKLCMWYGNHSRMLSFERGGNVKEYFEKKRKLNLLMVQPETVLNSKSSGTTSRTLLYGTPLKSFEQKFEALKYVREWLLEERGTTEEGKIVRNLNLIRDTRLLQEMIAFDFDGNFDSVLAFAECIIALREKYNQYQNEIVKENDKQDNILTFLNNSIASAYKNKTRQYNYN